MTGAWRGVTLQGPEVVSACNLVSLMLGRCEQSTPTPECYSTALAMASGHRSLQSYVRFRALAKHVA